MTLVGLTTLAPPAAAAETLEGKFEILHIHLDGGETRDVPQLVVGEQRYDLVGGGSDRLTPGAKVRVRGTIDGKRLDAESVKVLAPPASPPAGTTTKVLAILLYDDEPDDVTPEMLEQQLDGPDSQWFHDVSKGHIAGLAADATEWMAAPGVPCGDVPAAKQMAADAGYDLSAYDRYLVYSVRGCGWSGLATQGGTDTWIAGEDAFENGIILHELGHNYGLYHANSVGCHTGGPTCGHTEYGDRHDIMGSSSSTAPGVLPFFWTGHRGHYGAFHLDSLGWLSGRIVSAPSSGGKYDIAPIEQTAPGLQAVRLNDGATTYWIFYRQPIGMDAFLTPAAAAGVEIQIENFGITRGSHVLDMTPDGDFLDVALKLGQSWRTSNEAFEIKVIALGRKGATIQIKPAGWCKGSGWQNLAHPTGERFISNGDCSSYVAAGGTVVPFTGCVIRNDNSGVTTLSGLQAAHDRATAGDALTLYGTCTGAHFGKDLTVSGATGLAGYGAPTLTTAGAGGRPVTNVAGAEITLENLKVAGGSAGFEGGGILNSADLTLNDVVVSGGSASVGGGIANWGGLDDYPSFFRAGKLTLNDSTVTGNSSSQLGGGIFNGGEVTLNDSTVTGNTAAFGGGIYNLADATPAPTLTLNGTSAVTGNTPDDVVTATL